MKRNKLLFSGELPPRSIHGVSLSNDINLRYLRNRHKVYIDEEYVDFKFHGILDFRKIFNFIKRVLRVTYLSVLYQFDYFYIVFSTSTVGAIKTLILIFIFKSFQKGKVIVHVHRGDFKTFIDAKTINKKIFSMVAKKVSSFIVLSEETKKDFKSLCQVNIEVLENTVSKEYNFGAYDKKKKNKIDFVFISNFIEEKGILVLLEAFKNLPENLEISCYGNYTNPSLKGLIDQYKICKNISINTPIYGDEKFRRIFVADALILPSYNEGKPLILLEAMSVGTPFISTNVGYVKEIPYKDYPFLYDENSVDRLTKAITEFVKSEEKEKVSTSLKNRYFERFSNKVHEINLNHIFR